MLSAAFFKLRAYLSNFLSSTFHLSRPSSSATSAISTSSPDRTEPDRTAVAIACSTNSERPDVRRIVADQGKQITASAIRLFHNIYAFHKTTMDKLVKKVHFGDSATRPKSRSGLAQSHKGEFDYAKVYLHDCRDDEIAALTFRQASYRDLRATVPGAWRWTGHHMCTDRKWHMTPSPFDDDGEDEARSAALIGVPLDEDVISVDGSGLCFDGEERATTEDDTISIAGSRLFFDSPESSENDNEDEARSLSSDLFFEDNDDLEYDLAGEMASDVVDSENVNDNTSHKENKAVWEARRAEFFQYCRRRRADLRIFTTEGGAMLKSACREFSRDPWSGQHTPFFGGPLSYEEPINYEEYLSRKDIDMPLAWKLWRQDEDYRKHAKDGWELDEFEDSEDDATNQQGPLLWEMVSQEVVDDAELDMVDDLPYFEAEEYLVMDHEEINRLKRSVPASPAFETVVIDLDETVKGLQEEEDKEWLP